ncbi:uncharacterized protein [Saccopteryx leptura]|uniref:uncharacterized protein isoform X1 n=1 Tax=Saccopteryx leptura TaxID=249018 RepID=UPI00339D1B9E
MQHTAQMGLFTTATGQQASHSPAFRSKGPAPRDPDPRQHHRTAQKPPDLLLHGCVAQRVRLPNGRQGASSGEAPRVPVPMERHSPPAPETEVTGIRGSPGWGLCTRLILIALTLLENRQASGVNWPYGAQAGTLRARDLPRNTGRPPGTPWKELQTPGLPRAAGPTTLGGPSLLPVINLLSISFPPEAASNIAMAVRASGTENVTGGLYI